MNKKTRVSLGNALDIAHVEELKIRLEAALTKEPKVVMVADKVQRADTAGLQLVCAFLLKADTQGIKVSWQKPSAAILRTGRLLGTLSALRLADQATRE